MVRLVLGDKFSPKGDVRVKFSPRGDVRVKFSPKGDVRVKFSPKGDGESGPFFLET